MKKEITLELKDDSSKKSYFQWLWFFIQPQGKTFILLSINRIIRSGLFVITPLIIKYIIDYISTGSFESDPYFILWILGFYGLVKIIYFLQLYFTYEIEQKFNRSTISQLSLYSIRHILQLPTKWHESRGTGSKLGRIFEARSGLYDIFSYYFWTVLSSIGIILAIFITLLFSTPLFYTGLFIFFFLFFFFTAKKMCINLYKANNQVHIFNENNLSKVYDLTSSFSTVKNLNIGNNIINQATIEENKLFQKTKSRDRASNLRVFISDNLVGLICFGLIIMYAFFDMLNGNISNGTFILILLLTGDFWQALENVGDQYANYLESKNAFLRITTVLSEDIEKSDIKPVVAFPKNWTKIHYKNVDFGYNNQRKILKNINIEIEKGKKIAFVGHSGSGKSTIIKLLLKQYLIEQGDGNILFDDINIKNISKSDLLDNISFVSQDTELFNISLKENILIKSKHPEKLDEYIHKAHCSDFIEKLPMKENSIVGERGMMLSGGEKQRISIARALATENDIIIFDEATSALDSISERKIQQVVEESFEDKTLIIIAHRLSTIQHVDCIYVLEDGKIVEKGNFQELIKNQSTFKNLWEKQSHKTKQ